MNNDINAQLATNQRWYRELAAELLEAKAARDAWRKECERLRARLDDIQAIAHQQGEKLRKAGL